jgi:fructose-bisphosphate aldolase, class II
MITLNEALGDAQRKRIAIGHFNVSDLVALRAVTGAARALKVPVLIGTSEGERDFIGVHEIVAVVASLREELDPRSSSMPITPIPWNMRSKRRKQATI